MKWGIKNLEKMLLIGSTLVEGSTLTEAEAKSVLAGKTLHGHPVHEIRELLNYRVAVEWLIGQLDKSPWISQDLILDFHRRLFTGFDTEGGRWKNQSNYTYLSDGTRHDYESPGRVKSRMQIWVDEFNSLKKGTASDAARLYYEFQQIHPFADGNGRIGRIFMAYFIHKNLKKSFSFRLKDKNEHLKALEAANRGNMSLLENFFKKRITK